MPGPGLGSMPSSVRSRIHCEVRGTAAVAVRAEGREGGGGSGMEEEERTEREEEEVVLWWRLVNCEVAVADRCAQERWC